MTRPSLREYAAVQRERDLAATRAEKGTLLNEVVTVTGLHRKVNRCGPARHGQAEAGWLSWARVSPRTTARMR